MNLPRGSKRGTVGAFVVLALGATFAFGYGDDGVHRVTGVAESITGAAGDREAAERAALEETGGGEVISAERDDGGYDVDIVKGTQRFSVEIGGGNRVFGVETESRDQVGGAASDRAREAALEEAGGGEVISVQPDDGGYEVDVLDGDQEISVGLDSGYRVVEVETELRRR